MSNWESIDYLYNTPENGPKSYGRMIDDALRAEIKPPLRWSTGEVVHAHRLIKEHPAASTSIAKNILRLRAEGKFDEGFKIR